MSLQKVNDKKFFYYFFIIVSVAIFVVCAVRAALIPFSHDEAATFFYYIQSGNFLPYNAHSDANNHVLNSCLSWICFKLFGDSPFSLRLPNLLALLVLVVATYRISQRLTHIYAKLAIVAFFLLSFHWLSFYSLCRGYGLSMAFLVLSMSYLIDFFNSFELKKLFLFYLFLQIAISANLILVIISIPLTFSVLVFQFLNKELIKKVNVLVLFVHLMLLLFWIKFSFSLQEGGHLYAGKGASYWHITFISLIELLSGTTSRWIPFIVLFSFLFLVIVALSTNFNKARANVQHVFTPSLFYTLMLIVLIGAFYGMKVFLHINYPEDRIGLFFYVFFAIAIVFMFDQFNGIPVKIISGFIVVAALIHFAWNINFRKHSLSMYDTIPERFYTRLLEEQKASDERITINGQIWGEFIYGFWNYRYNGALNLINVSDNKMPMNCDYAISWKPYEKYYKPYYDEIDRDEDWNITLLKRKEKIRRNLLLSVDSLKPIQGNAEFYNLYQLKDTCFKNKNPLLVEVNIGSIQAEMPVGSWLVLEIDSTGGNAACYKRIPLNWIRYDWSNLKDQKLDFVSESLPLKVHSLICYVWNLEKKEMKIKINSVKIYQLEGNGINVSVSTRLLGAP